MPVQKTGSGHNKGPHGSCPSSRQMPKCPSRAGALLRIHILALFQSMLINETSPASESVRGAGRGLHAVATLAAKAKAPAPTSIVSPRDVDGAAEVHAVGAGSTPPQPAAALAI